MFKKILTGLLLTAAIGILAFGAVNRTYAKATSSQPLSESAGLSEQNGGGNGNSHSPNYEKLDGCQDDCIADGEAYGAGAGACQGLAAGDHKPPANGTRYQYEISSNGSTAGAGLGSGLEESRSDMDEWVSTTASVTSVTDIEWILTLEDGTPIVLNYRVVEFLESQGFSVSPGEEVILTGFFDINGDFEIGQIENTTSEGTAIIRDESGRPLWSGSHGSGGPKN